MEYFWNYKILVYNVNKRLQSDVFAIFQKTDFLDQASFELRC